MYETFPLYIFFEKKKTQIILKFLLLTMQCIKCKAMSIIIFCPVQLIPTNNTIKYLKCKGTIKNNGQNITLTFKVKSYKHFEISNFIWVFMRCRCAQLSSLLQMESLLQTTFNVDNVSVQEQKH